MIAKMAKNLVRKNPRICQNDWEDLVQEVKLYELKNPEHKRMYKHIMIDCLRKFTKSSYGQNGVKEDSTIFITYGLSVSKAIDHKDPRYRTIKNEEKEIIHQALTNLKKSYQRIIYFKHFKYYTFNQIAKIENTTPGNCHQKYKKALKKLRIILKPLIKA